MTEIHTIKALFESLVIQQQEDLIDELSKDIELKSPILVSVNEELRSNLKVCIHCNSSHVLKRGKRKGIQTYQCKTCSKWFSETTNTSIWKIKKKEKWQLFIRLTQDRRSLKFLAKEVGISEQTAFNWRHKILSSLSSLVPKTLSQVVECDEMEFRKSQKGTKCSSRKPRKRGSDFKRNNGKFDKTVVQAIVAIQRGGDKIINTIESKKLTTKEIEIALKDKLEKNTILITDKNVSYKSYISQCDGIKHKTVLSSDFVNPKDKSTHIQNVNQTHGAIRDFLRRFKEVSSKYLLNYLNWFAYAPKFELMKSTIKNWLLSIFQDTKSYQRFIDFKTDAVNIRV